MKRISIIILIAALGLTAMAQKLTFHSAEFELGVKIHLGLNEDADVLQSQADTITAIDLSGLGITDIRDVEYLPQVKELNLSNNGITDVFPLVVLDSLSLLNLCNNELESINPLVFSNADKMRVLIAYNYISDFTYFLTPSKCQITLIGMGQQQEKNAPYFDVYQLYADIENGQPVVKYRGYSNMEESAFLQCGSTHVNAVLNGSYNSVSITGNLTSTTEALLSNGEKGDTTYVVPPTHYEAVPGRTITVKTGLPDSYSIGYANAIYGTVTVDGLSLKYKAPATQEPDVLYISYYKGKQLKGFTEFSISLDGSIPTAVQQLASDDQQLKLAWKDGKLIVVCPEGALGDCKEATISVWNAAGQLLATEDVDASHGIDTMLNVSARRGNVAIVQVDCCGRRIIGKCFLAQ